MLSYLYFQTHAGTSGSAVWGVGLRLLACWVCGFESHRWHGRLSLVSVVCCQKSERRADLSSREVLPTLVRNLVRSRHLMNEKAMAHWGAVVPPPLKKIKIKTHIQNYIKVRTNFISHSDRYYHLKNIDLSSWIPIFSMNKGTSEKWILKYMELIVRHLIKGTILEFVYRDCDKAPKMTSKLHNNVQIF
jgi:hypothetical protein